MFQRSLWYLPVMLGLMMFHKQEMEWLGISTDEARRSDSVNKEKLYYSNVWYAPGRSFSLFLAGFGKFAFPPEGLQSRLQ